MFKTIASTSAKAMATPYFNMRAHSLGQRATTLNYFSKLINRCFFIGLMSIIPSTWSLNRARLNIFSRFSRNDL